VIAIEDIRAALDRISDGVEEARAAADTAMEGDPTALRALDDAVDALARELADLKARTSVARL
jgi:hypothetical protein